MVQERQTWGRQLPKAVRFAAWPLGVAVLVLYTVGFLRTHNWAPLIAPAGVLGTVLTSRTAGRIEIEGETVTFVLAIRKVSIQARSIRRVYRRRVSRTVVAETSAGKIKIQPWLVGLHDLIVQLKALNPSLLIDGP